MLTFGQNDIDLSDNSSNGGARLPDMSEQPLGSLLNPHMTNPRDASKWIAEAHKRLSSPFSALSYAFVGLLSVLTGTFRRHGSFIRPLVAVGAMVALLALGFAVQNLAAGDAVWLPLMWLQAIASRRGLRLAVAGTATAGPIPIPSIVPRRHSDMTVPVTLSFYIARQFTGWVTAMALGLAGLVSMFDFIELLRRSTTKPDATFGIVSEIAALRLPYIAMQILPFAVLVGGILCFWRLTRSSELIVARAAGISAWEFLSAPTACALSAGCTRHLWDQSVVVGDVRACRHA